MHKTHGPLGANFIHGTEGNPLADIAEEVASKYVYAFALRRFYDSRGKSADDDTKSFIFKKIMEYASGASTYSRENDVDKERSLGDYCEEQLYKDEEVHNEHTRQLIASGMKMLSGMAACDIEKLSLKYYWMEEDLPVALLF